MREEIEGKSEYPACRSCGNAMVWTFAFPYKEYACLPCNKVAEMFNSLEKVLRSDKYMADKKRKWEKDLSVIARRIGGAMCGIKGCKEGNCEWCKRAADKNYKFEYWKKGND